MRRRPIRATQRPPRRRMPGAARARRRGGAGRRRGRGTRTNAAVAQRPGRRPQLRSERVQGVGKEGRQSTEKRQKKARKRPEERTRRTSSRGIKRSYVKVKADARKYGMPTIRQTVSVRECACAQQQQQQQHTHARFRSPAWPRPAAPPRRARGPGQRRSPWHHR